MPLEVFTRERAVFHPRWLVTVVDVSPVFENIDEVKGRWRLHRIGRVLWLRKSWSFSGYEHAFYLAKQLVQKLEDCPLTLQLVRLEGRISPALIKEVGECHIPIPDVNT